MMRATEEGLHEQVTHRTLGVDRFGLPTVFGVLDTTRSVYRYSINRLGESERNNGLGAMFVFEDTVSIYGFS